MTSTRFCPVCGTANEQAQTHYVACGHPLLASTEGAHMPDGTLLHGHSRLLAQPKGERSTPDVSQREPPIKKGLSRRKLLIGGLGAGVVVVGAALVGGSWLMSTPLSQSPKKLVDKHRILNLPLEGGLSYTWLSDNTHIAGATYEKLFLVDVKRGRKVWEQKRSSAGRVDKILWPSDGRHVAEVKDDGIVVWDIQSRRILWNEQLEQRARNIVRIVLRQGKTPGSRRFIHRRRLDRASASLAFSPSSFPPSASLRRFSVLSDHSSSSTIERGPRIS